MDEDLRHPAPLNLFHPAWEALVEDARQTELFQQPGSNPRGSEGPAPLDTDPSDIDRSPLGLGAILEQRYLRRSTLELPTIIDEGWVIASVGVAPPERR